MRMQYLATSFIGKFELQRCPRLDITGFLLISIKKFCCWASIYNKPGSGIEVFLVTIWLTTLQLQAEKTWLIVC